MSVVLDFDGSRFYLGQQAFSVQQVLRWLRWRRPPFVELRCGAGRLRVGGERLTQLLLRPAELAALVRAARPSPPPPPPAPAERIDSLYRTLGLPPGSDGAAVKRAYRHLARLHHPDRGGTVQSMQQLNQAYVELAAWLQTTGPLSCVGGA